MRVYPWRVIRDAKVTRTLVGGPYASLVITGAADTIVCTDQQGDHVYDSAGRYLGCTPTIKAA